ncbi:MAG: hypothetical protein RLZZ440_44 [Planctomycetota bacterium]|jgi:uncharacterized membrane protein
MSQAEINDAEWRNPDNWSGGFYFSKRDTRTWVPKRIPAMGWTLNIGTRAGAAWMVALLVGLPIFMVIVMGLALRR